MATELKPPYVIPCTATELDEAIENSHTHPNKTDLDAIGTAALRDVGTDVGQVPVVGEDGKIDPSLTPETYVHPATHPASMITGLGTAAAKDTGTSAGNVPVLGSDGKLASEVLPEIPSPTIVYNGLDSESTTDALSAAQGKILADQIDGLTASDITYEGTDLNSALLTLDSRVLAAQTDAQGALAGITSLQTTIGDIGTILDDINGEVV